MSGYTPVFDSVFKGSLYGKWPDTAAWICLLALADWRGHVDVTPEAIAGMTGMPLKDLNDCIKRFCEPDPRSRSQEAEGRKLIPIDPNRDWGWIVVNIQKYREKARNQNQISDGRNAEKVRRYKERHRKTPEDTGGNRETPNSDSDSDSDSDKDKIRTPLPPKGEVVQGLDLKAWGRWISYRADIRKPLKQASIPAAQRKLAALGSDQAAAVENSIANGWTGLFAPDKAKPAAPTPIRSKEFGT